MLLHMISYVLFIASMLLYLFVYAAQKHKVVSTMTIIICISTLLSEGILVYIFIRICVGNDSETQQKVTDIQTINKQSSLEQESSSDED